MRQQSRFVALLLFLAGAVPAFVRSSRCVTELEALPETELPPPVIGPDTADHVVRALAKAYALDDADLFKYETKS